MWKGVQEEADEEMMVSHFTAQILGGSQPYL